MATTSGLETVNDSDIRRRNNDGEIAHWQASAHSEEDDGNSGIVARILRACIESLTYLAQLPESPSTSRRDRTYLRRCTKLLKLWATGHGAWDGKLDGLLDRSRNLRHTTISILSPLCKILSNAFGIYIRDANDPVAMRLRAETAQFYSQTKWLISGPEESASDTDSDSDASGPEDVSSPMSRLAEDLRTHLDCLLDLSNALEYPAEDPDENDDKPSALRVGQRVAHDYHAELILAKFPKVQIELAECLGKISWDRYQRMQQERDHNARANAASAIGEDFVVEAATKSDFADSEFQDSGLGTSLPSAPATRYAETIISYMTSMAGGKRVQIPSLPAEAKAGAKFECNACGKFIYAQTNREWRKHLYLDLRPYTCFYARCSFSSIPFADRQLWSNHLELDHQFGPNWESTTCPLCLEATEPGKSQTLIHFARHMEDIALAALPREVESDAESDDATNHGSAQNLSDQESHMKKEDVTFTPLASPAGTPSEDMPFQVPESLVPGAYFSPLISPALKAQKDPHENHLLSISTDYPAKNVDISRLGEPLLQQETEHNLKTEDSLSEMSSQHEVFCDILQEDDGALRNLGTARCKLLTESITADHIIVFTAKDDATKTLLSIGAKDQTQFRKVGESTITWHAENGRSTIVEFTQPEKRDRFWGFLDVVRGLRPSKYLANVGETCSHETQSGGLCIDCSRNMNEARSGLQSQSHPTEDSHYTAPDGYWSIEEQRSFRDYIRQYGMNWTTIAEKLGTKTSEMVRAQYFRDVQNGDTELEQMAQDAPIYNANSVYAAGSEAFQRPLPDPTQLGLRIERIDDEVEKRRKLATPSPTSEGFGWVSYHHNSQTNRLAPSSTDGGQGRTRKKAWTAEQRSYAALMRGIGACTNCKARKEKCDPGTPCRSCLEHYKGDLVNHPCRRLKCICGSADDDGHLVSCETCNTQQHIVCYYDFSMPEIHRCTDCASRPLPSSGAANNISKVFDEHGATENATTHLNSAKPNGPTGGYSHSNPQTIKEEESSTIKCICRSTEDDGNTVLCEKCDTWQHIACYYESVELVPEVHECADCTARPVDSKGKSSSSYVAGPIAPPPPDHAPGQSDAIMAVPMSQGEPSIGVFNWDFASAEQKQIINQFAYKLMESCNPDVRVKFEQDVEGWPEDKKQQLKAEGITPLFFRFRQHAEMMYKRGSLKGLQGAIGNPMQSTHPSAPPFDQTGQVAPAGARPRVTATLWEDEATLVFQVEAKHVCVARREDNHMINGTKLLNVAGISRGLRDGILKSEPTRHVVKIGPMHLKGVWVPFGRALAFANKERITDILYPLFVHDIGALLDHPSNQSLPTTSAMLATSGVSTDGLVRSRPLSFGSERASGQHTIHTGSQSYDKNALARLRPNVSTTLDNTFQYSYPRVENTNFSVNESTNRLRRPDVPKGWEAVWSDQYGRWFFVNVFTGQKQWEEPTEPVHPDTMNESYHRPTQDASWSNASPHSPTGAEFGSPSAPNFTYPWSDSLERTALHGDGAPSTANTVEYGNFEPGLPTQSHWYRDRESKPSQGHTIEPSVLELSSSATLNSSLQEPSDGTARHTFSNLEAFAPGEIEAELFDAVGGLNESGPTTISGPQDDHTAPAPAQGPPSAKEIYDFLPSHGISIRDLCRHFKHRISRADQKLFISLVKAACIFDKASKLLRPRSNMPSEDLIQAALNATNVALPPKVLGRRCPYCLNRGDTVWVRPDKVCPQCGTWADVSTSQS